MVTDHDIIIFNLMTVCFDMSRQIGNGLRSELEDG